MTEINKRNAVRILLAVAITAMTAGIVVPVSSSAEVQKKKKKRSNSRGTEVQSVSAGSASGLSKNEIDAMVAAHNKLRSQQGVPGLKWSEDLARYAQTWADRLSRNGCKMEHRPDEGEFRQQYGENIALTIQGTSFVDQAVGMWEKERSKYNGQPLTEDNFGEVGHYTQIMWRKTTQFGCGISNCKSFTIVVCNYNPAGNFLGQSAW